jgi:hypothetical protein
MPILSDAEHSPLSHENGHSTESPIFSCRKANATPVVRPLGLFGSFDQRGGTWPNTTPEPTGIVAGWLSAGVVGLFIVVGCRWLSFCR